MKNILISVITPLLFPVLAQAQNFGYVVKVDSGSVYLDTTLSSAPVHVGQEFTVFEEGDELVNPVTKVSLGRMQKNIADGFVTETMPKYSVGKLRGGADAVKAGQRVKWKEFLLPPAQQPETLRSSNIEGAVHEAAVWESQPLDAVLVDIALGNITGGDSDELACASEDRLTVYSLEGVKLSTVAAADIPDPERVISLEAMDLKKTGRAQIFVTAYNSFREELHTFVYELKDGKLEKTDRLKWLVRAADGADGKPRLYAQELYTDSSFQASAIKELVYENGKFTTKQSLSYPRMNWLYGFNLVDIDLDGKQELVYTMDTNKIRLQYERRKAYIDTDTVFGKTPNRLKWREQILKFYSRIPVHRGANGEFYFYGMINTTANGLLAESMGRYINGKLRFMKWTGGGLATVKEVVTEGYVYDIACGSLGNLPSGILVPSVGVNDKTVIKLFPY